VTFKVNSDKGNCELPIRPSMSPS